jgi:hypothetical protein
MEKYFFIERVKVPNNKNTVPENPSNKLKITKQRRPVKCAKQSKLETEGQNQF